MKNFKKHKWSLAIILFGAIILMLPMFLNPYHENDDSIYHLANILSVAESMKHHGLFGSPILPLLANDFGYASHLLYPPLAHTLTGLVYHLSSSFLSLETVMKIIHFLVLLASGYAMYGLALKFNKNSKVACLSSLLYMTFPYQLSESYVRSALGESFLFIFLPLILSGLLSLLNGDKKRFYPLFVIGYVGGILSHFTVMIFATLFFAIFLLFYHKKVFKKEFLIPFIIASSFVLGITLFYLTPMIEYKIKGGIAVFMPNLMSQGIYYTTLWPWQFLPTAWQNNEVSFHFTIISLILMGITIWKHKKITFPEYTKGLILVFIIFFIMITKAFYWDALPSILFMLQFAWRLVTFTGLAFVLIAPLCLLKTENKKIFGVLIIFILALSLGEIHFRNENLINVHTNEEIIASGSSIGWQQEYLPINAHESEYWQTRDHEIHFQKGQGEISIIESQTPTLKFEVKNIQEEVILELPRFFYLGYTLENDQQEGIFIQENSNGFIETKISRNGIYTLKYKGTTFMKIANIISIVAIIMFIVFLSFNHFKDKGK